MKKTFTVVALLILSMAWSEAYSQLDGLIVYQPVNSSQASFIPDSQSSPMEMKKRRKKKSKKRGKKGSKDAFASGTSVATVYYGWPNIMGSIFKVYETYPGFTSSSLGPLGGKFEYGVSDKIGIGLTVNALNSSINYTGEGYDENLNPVTYEYGIKYNSLSVNLRFNIHYFTTGNLDVYIGAGPGYSYKNVDYSSTDPDFVSGTLNFSLIPISFELTQGVRYYFTPNIGAFAEIGLSKGYLQGGIVAKF